MKFATKPIRHYPPHLRHIATIHWEIKMQIVCRCSAHMEENANKLHFYRLYLSYSSTNFDIFSEVFPVLIANKIFYVAVFYWFTFAINLWYPKFITTVFVNSQHDIQ